MEGNIQNYRHIPQKQMFDGKKLRKSIARKAVDYNSTMLYHVHNRHFFESSRDHPTLQDHSAYVKYMLPPVSYSDVPNSSITGVMTHSSVNQHRYPVFSVCWTPEGRRLITGNSFGEFTLWNGIFFNFEQLLQAHNASIRVITWTHNGTVMVAGDDDGVIKYWHPNMNNVGTFIAHDKESIRGISFAQSDAKFVSCSDSSVIKVWDFYEMKETTQLTGHGWDVKCVDWHPQSSLIVSGSKDSLIKLWDARTSDNIATLTDHNKHVLKVRWNKNGNWILSGSGDHQIKLFDIRTMKAIETFRGHKKEVYGLTWHPIHEGFFTSAGSDGTIMFWDVGLDECVGKVTHEKDTPVWDLTWHPLGHILVSGGNDKSTKFWIRDRPGEPYQRAKTDNAPTQESMFEEMKLMEDGYPQMN